MILGSGFPFFKIKDMLAILLVFPFFPLYQCNFDTGNSSDSAFSSTHVHDLLFCYIE